MPSGRIGTFATGFTCALLAASMTACSKDLPSGPDGGPLPDATEPGIVLQAAPANDDFGGRVVIGEIPFTDTISTVEATTDGDDPIPTCAANGTGPTVWYAYTPSRNTVLQATTFGSDYDTDLVLYTGTRGNLTELACNDDSEGVLQSSLTFVAERGQTYYFMVGAFASGPGGTLVFNLDVGSRRTSASHFLFRGLGADAFFISASGCVQTVVDVLASRQWIKETSGPPLRGPFAQVIVDRFDTCTGTQLTFFFGSTAEGVGLEVHRRLTDASLQVTIPGFDFVTETEALVTVDLDWTGSGSLVRTSERIREVFPGGMLKLRFSGKRRDASASGTVRLGGVNLTPAPSESGSIFDAKSSTLILERAIRP